MAEDVYRVFIRAKLNGVDIDFNLDLCKSRTVTSNANIAQFPVQNAETVSDHMYRLPRTVSLSGSFSLNGRAAYEDDNRYTRSYIMKHGKGGTKTWEDWFEAESDALTGLSDEWSQRLESIQTLYEYIQAKGILCDILMIQQSAKGSQRFKIRSNMALQSISWNEEYNSMSFTMNFSEIIQVAAISEFETFMYDERYPSPNAPAARSMGAIIQESGKVVETVIKALIDEGYIDKGDANLYVHTAAKNVGMVFGIAGLATVIVNVLIAAGVLVAVFIKAALAGTAVAAAAGPVGWVALAAVAIAAGCAYGIYKLIDNAKKRERLKAGFNLIRDYSKYVDPKTFEVKDDANLTTAKTNEQDLGRLRQLLENCQRAVNDAVAALTVYQIESNPDDNTEREVWVQVGADLLKIKLTKAQNALLSNENELEAMLETLQNALPGSSAYLTAWTKLQDSLRSPWTIQIYRNGEGDPIAPYFGQWTPASDIYDMNASTNLVYRDTTGQYELYLYNPSLMYAKDDTKDLAENYKALYNAVANLSNYYFIVSNGSIEPVKNRLSKAITKTLETAGFEVSE